MLTIAALIMTFQLGALALVLALAKYSVALVDESGHVIKPSRWQERTVGPSIPTPEAAKNVLTS
jgi:hypothetical protein